MVLDADAAYLALKARDARFDGQLFVGVTSTGIYCRPVCRVRTPQRRNCRFFALAAQAEQAGFRPCLRCRPELAPGLSLVDSPQALAQQAARLLEHAARAGQAPYLGRVAARLGITERHLRRIFQQAHGVSPQAFLDTQRLLLAKQLLTDTALPVTEVALASGYASLRRFHAAFAQRYRLQPMALRRTCAAARGGGALVVRLGYRPPYDVDGVLAFLRARAVPGVEAVDVESRTLWRVIAVEHRANRVAGWVRVDWPADRAEVELRLADALVPALGAVVERVRQGLDLDADPAAVGEALAPLGARDGLRVIGGFDGFEAAARAGLGQQGSVAAARTLAARLVERHGAPVDAPRDDLRQAFPDAATLADAGAEALAAVGLVRRRAAALHALAQAVAEGRIALHRGAPLAPTLAALQALPGIGDWTAQLIAMRALAWPDAFPAGDLGVRQALGEDDIALVRERAAAWRPWRAYAVTALWQRLETASHPETRP